jgi:DNA-binding HxlR family transcriptional regulator
MLSQQLKEMERDGIVIRRDYHEIPSRVEYSLTEKGSAARPIIDALVNCGKSFM